MPIMEGTFLFIEIQDQTLFSLWYLELLLLHPVVSVDAGVGAGVSVHGLAHLMEQLRGLLGEGGGVKLAGNVLLVVAVVAVVVLAGPADQANRLENWKQERINPVSFYGMWHLNSLTIVAGEILIDPGEAELCCQHGREAHVDIIGVQGGLVCVLISKGLQMSFMF